VVEWVPGVRGRTPPILDTLLDESGWFVVCLAIIVPLYIARVGWLLGDGGYNRHGAPARAALGISALANLWNYH